MDTACWKTDFLREMCMLTTTTTNTTVTPTGLIEKLFQDVNKKTDALLLLTAFMAVKTQCI